jgi:DUF1016 N-terminal domain
MTDSPDQPKLNTPESAIVPMQLLDDIRHLIQIGRDRIAQTVNTELVLLHWHIGDHIHRDILNKERAGYGEQIVEALGKVLTAEYGRGFGRRNLFNMMQFAEVFPDPTIVQTLSAQLAWSHFLEIIYLKDSLQQTFYAEMC